MIRKIIHIDKEKCNGCGLCASACHEGAIGMVDGKAQLLREDYCDGLGDCLPACPTGAITFVEREAAAYDEAAVKEHLKNRKAEASVHTAASVNAVSPANNAAPVFGGCPGSRMRSMQRKNNQTASAGSDASSNAASNTVPASYVPESQLTQWPVQIILAPVNAPYFNNARLLIAADCTAFAYGNFHEKFIKNHITLIGCPKLDDVDYSEKLSEIIRNNNIKDISIVRMEVPCCGGIVMAVQNALKQSGKMIPWQVVTISIDGEIME
ncbi:MAG TPA: ferredoxin [Roseburia sp.]|nr:ferredoxin [Roseburia sp.]